MIRFKLPQSQVIKLSFSTSNVSPIITSQPNIIPIITNQPNIIPIITSQPNIIPIITNQPNIPSSPAKEELKDKQGISLIHQDWSITKIVMEECPPTWEEVFQKKSNFEIKELDEDLDEEVKNYGLYFPYKK